jgi:hypothetical protein
MNEIKEEADLYGESDYWGTNDDEEDDQEFNEYNCDNCGIWCDSWGGDGLCLAQIEAEEAYYKNLRHQWIKDVFIRVRNWLRWIRLKIFPTKTEVDLTHLPF